jgi:hypothetical protein
MAVDTVYFSGRDFPAPPAIRLGIFVFPARPSWRPGCITPALVKSKKAFRATLLLLVGASTLAPRARADGRTLAIPRPAADAHCSVPAETRARRIRFMDGEIARLEQGTRVSNRSLDEFQSALESMNRAYFASKICMGVAMAAATVASLGAVYEVYFAKEALTLASFTFSMTTSRVVTAIGGARTVIAGPLGVGFLMRASHVNASALEELQRRQIDELKETPLLGDGAVNFLSSPDCSGYRCPVVLAPLEEAARGLSAWRDQASRRLDEEDAWWLPELFSRAYGERLAKIEIPFTMNAIDILQMRLSYARLLRSILAHDAVACARPS